MNKLARTTRINFIRTLGTGQGFIATKQMLHQEKNQMNLHERAWWHFNLPCPHSPLPHSEAVLKMSYSWYRFLVLEEAEQTLFSKNYGFVSTCLVTLCRTSSKGLPFFLPNMHIPPLGCIVRIF